MGNSVIFPAPKESKIPLWMGERLCFFSKSKPEDSESASSKFSFSFCCSDRKTIRKIPYLYFKEETDDNKKQYLLIYFHGNSESLTNAFKPLERYHGIFRINLIAPEYAGYGLYDTDSPSEEAIFTDAELIIRTCIDKLGYNEEDIILMGRSLGTGVVAKMGTIFTKVRGLIMISPYLSIREVAKSLVGGFFSKFVPDIFRTQELIDQIKSPLLLIHGTKDRLIPCTNSKYIYDLCNSPKMINLSTTMDHNKIDFRNDLYLPMLKFFVDKLNMVEFLQEYNSEDIERVSALSSLENPFLKTPTGEIKFLGEFLTESDSEGTKFRLKAVAQDVGEAA